MTNSARNKSLPSPAFDFQIILELLLLVLEVLDRIQEVLGIDLSFGGEQ